FSSITSVVVRSDGEILAAGGLGDLRQSPGTSGISEATGGQLDPFDFSGLVTRLTADGNVDRSFGDDGYVVPPGQMEIWQVLVRSDGSTVLLGEGYWGWTVSLLRADGSPDPDFGTNGQVSTSSFPMPSGQWLQSLPLLSLLPD